MGSGTYSAVRVNSRSVSYGNMRTEDIFVNKMNEEMSPVGTIRECCDSTEHPNTIPIIIALDITGSMGYIPDNFIREEMGKMLGNLYKKGLTESQVLFLGIGDHECDNYPLQVGQFEADDQLMDKWLKNIYLEGGGGANSGESYLLAWLYAARHTKLDSFDKRGKKGFLFTIGDEPNLKGISVEAQRKIFGDNGEYEYISSAELLKEVSLKYNVYHLNICETRSGAKKAVQDGWIQNLDENAIMLESYKDIEKVIVEFVSNPNEINNTIVDKPEVEDML